LQIYPRENESGIPVDSTGIKFQESRPRSRIPIYIPVKIYQYILPGFIRDPASFSWNPGICQSNSQWDPCIFSRDPASFSGNPGTFQSKSCHIPVYFDRDIYWDPASWPGFLKFYPSGIYWDPGFIFSWVYLQISAVLGERVYVVKKKAILVKTWHTVNFAIQIFQSLKKANCVQPQNC
jgi:hypothetical protein